MTKINSEIGQAELQPPIYKWEQPPTNPVTDLPVTDLNSTARYDGLSLESTGRNGLSVQDDGVSMEETDSAVEDEDVDQYETPYVHHDPTTANLALAAASLVATFGAVYLGTHMPPATTHPNVSSVEQVQPASSEAVKRANETARDLANGIITILAKPGSGAVAYRGDMVGNKTAVIGPDGKFPSADDNKTPESFVGFDPAKGEIYVSSTQEYFPNGIKDKKHTEFTRVFVTLKVGENNSLYGAKGQLQITDYEKALSQPDTLTLESVEASLHTGINPGPEVSVAVNDAGKLETTVYENGQYAKNPGMTKAAEGEESFDGLTVRADQIEVAALQDLQNGVK